MIIFILGGSFIGILGGSLMGSGFLIGFPGGFSLGTQEMFLVPHFLNPPASPDGLVQLI